MPTRTLKAFVNDGVCSRITSDFDRIEVDGETVWTAKDDLREKDNLRKKDDLREELASLMHDVWSHWMKHLFSKCREEGAPGYLIPREAVDRWRRQSNTSYDELTEEEKDSDREQADKVLELLRRC